MSEDLQGCYTQTETGFTLDVDAESNEAVAGLKSALEKEREQRKTFQDKVDQMQTSMADVTKELAQLQRKDQESNLRSAVVSVIPETVRPDAIDDVLHYAQSELQLAEDGSSYQTADGSSVDTWLKKLLDKKPFWLKPSEGAGVSGGGGGRVPPKTNSAEQIVSDAFNGK